MHKAADGRVTPTVAALPQALQELILANSGLRSYRKGEVITREGEPAKGMGAVLDGQVHLTRNVGNRADALVGVGHAGFWFGIYGTLSGGRPSIGGLVAATAFALVLLSEGLGEARRLLRIDPLALVGAGLLVALASGVLPLLRGRPYMTGLWLKVPLPVVGKVGSPVVFDVGVYLVVLGTVLAILFALAEEEA